MSEDKKFKKVFDLILKTKNAELLEAFHEYHVGVIEQIDERMKRLDELEKSDLNRTLDLNKLKNEVHDSKIEIHHVAKETKEDFIKVAGELFDKMPSVNKAVLNHPRFSGLLLLLRGHGFVKQLTDIDIGKISKGYLHDTSSKEESDKK